MRTVLLALLAVWASGPALGHKRDGQFTDRGPLTAHERFDLDLGAVDLAKPNRLEFQFADLPSEEFTFGLRLTAAQHADIERPKAGIRLRLLNEKDEVVFDISRPLPDWVWSKSPGRAFVYVRGAETEIPVQGGATTLKRVSVGPDGGWGTYVLPRKRATYRLVFETVTPDPAATKFVMRLVAVGGGWK